MGRYRYLAVATVVLVAAQTGCEAGAGPRGPSDQRPASETGLGTAQPSGAVAPPDAVPPELQGTWSLDVYCAVPGGTREGRGFGRIAERPARSEGRRAGPTTMTLTLYPEYFELSWPRPDGTWQVGWSGAATVRQKSLYLDYRYPDGIRDSFAWSARGRRLSLRYPAAGRMNGPAGGPTPVARFSLPSTAVDCPPDRPGVAAVTQTKRPLHGRGRSG